MQACKAQEPRQQTYFTVFQTFLKHRDSQASHAFMGAGKATQNHGGISNVNQGKANQGISKSGPSKIRATW